MRIFKAKPFSRWAEKEGLSDDDLLRAVREIRLGLIDADLGGHVIKQRVALPGRGKRGGVRTLVVYQAERRAFFVYGFAKNSRSNVRADELRALKRYALELLSYRESALSQALAAGVLIEVQGDG